MRRQEQNEVLELPESIFHSHTPTGFLQKTTENADPLSRGRVRILFLPQILTYFVRISIHIEKTGRIFAIFL